MMVSLHMRRGIVDFVGLGFRTDRSSSDLVSPDSMFIVQVSLTYWHALGSVTHGTSCPTSLHAHAPVPVPIFVNICMRVCYRVESAGGGEFASFKSWAADADKPPPATQR